VGDTEQRLPDRLARRERNVPIPDSDNVDALAATIADWGASAVLRLRMHAVLDGGLH
jgi:hypothetical protein